MKKIIKSEIYNQIKILKDKIDSIKWGMEGIPYADYNMDVINSSYNKIEKIEKKIKVLKSL